MPRCHGSYIGHVPAPTQSSASGIWVLRDAQENLASGVWPSQPEVPAAPTAVQATATSALVSWEPFAVSPTVTDYGVQYSSDAGGSWTTFSDSVGDVNSVEVDDLVTGETYIFRLYGKNVLGSGPYGSSSAPLVLAAPTIALLMHFDEDVTTDSGDIGLTVAPSSGSTIAASSDESVFGGASALFDGTGYLSVTPASELSFGTGAFTIDYWVYVTGGSTYKNMLELGTYGDYPATRLAIHIYNNGKLTVENTGAPGWPADPDSFPLNQWVHVAVTRDSESVMRLFRDGVLVSSETITQSLAASVVNIGMQWDGAHFTGYMDELRIVKGRAMFTDTFTPPDEPY